MAYRWKNEEEIMGTPQPLPLRFKGMQTPPAMQAQPQQSQVMTDFMDAERLGGWNAPQQTAPAPAASADVLAKIREKQARLAAVDARIEEIDKQYPELKNGGQEWKIAAKRAELGDMSAYDSMMSRGRQAGGNVKDLESKIRKAYIDQSFAGPEQRPAYQNEINALEKEYKELTGQEYVFDGTDVKKGLTQSGDEAVTLADVKSKLSTMKKNGQITAAQEAEIMGDLQKMPFSEDLVNLYNELKSTPIKEKVDEAKRKRAAKQMQADEAAKNWDTNRDVSVKINEWNKLVKAKAPITLFYKLNDYGNPVPKGGI